MTDYSTIGDIDGDKNFILITDSQDIKATLEHIGMESLYDEVGCLFVDLLDGEYGEIYYSGNSIPDLRAYVHKIYG